MKRSGLGLFEVLSGDLSTYSKDKSELKYSRYRDISQVWLL
jgi:hypothetical protein